MSKWLAGCQKRLENDLWVVIIGKLAEFQLARKKLLITNGQNLGFGADMRLPSNPLRSKRIRRAFQVEFKKVDFLSLELIFATPPPLLTSPLVTAKGFPATYLESIFNASDTRSVPGEGTCKTFPGLHAVWLRGSPRRVSDLSATEFYRVSPRGGTSNFRCVCALLLWYLLSSSRFYNRS